MPWLRHWPLNYGFPRIAPFRWTSPNHSPTPTVPTADPDYLQFRLETQYGGDGRDREPDPEDLVTYLHWCRDLPR